jgi:hypothetical protein
VGIVTTSSTLLQLYHLVILQRREGKGSILAGTSQRDIPARLDIVWRRRWQAIERGDRTAISSLRILKRDANEARRIAREAVTIHATNSP